MTTRYQIKARTTRRPMLAPSAQQTEVKVYDILSTETGEVLSAAHATHADAERKVIAFMADDARTAREYGQPANTTHYAAVQIDADTVYGIGDSPEAALRDGRSWSEEAAEA
jgi:hypothetical protein